MIFISTKSRGLKWLGYLTGLILAGFAMTGKSDEATLSCARNLATEYKDYTHGSGPSKIDCVHFILKVVECRLGEPVSADVKKAILLSYGWSKEEAKSKAKEGTDPKLGGVQYALTMVLNKGTTVAPVDAKPGDLVQYWIPRANGKWFGHSAVITKLHGTMATILGAHESANSVSELNQPLNLLGTNRHVFIVRIGS